MQYTKVAQLFPSMNFHRMNILGNQHPDGDKHDQQPPILFHPTWIRRLDTVNCFHGFSTSHGFYSIFFKFWGGLLCSNR